MSSEERSKQMIDGIIKQEASRYHGRILSTAEDQCLKRIQVTSRNIGVQFMQRIRLLPMRPNREQAFDEIAELWRTELKDWTRDDLLFALSLANAQINVNQISDELV